jgi:hypothetical protein
MYSGAAGFVAFQVQSIPYTSAQALVEEGIYRLGKAIC